MRVFKFGGASVKDGAGLRNLANIVSQEQGNLVIVISAFGKTTNALEEVLKAWLDNDKHCFDLLDKVFGVHLLVVNELFSPDSEVKGRLSISYTNLKNYLMTETGGEYDYEYDQIVSYGEIWSTIIVEAFLKVSGMQTEWLDIRELLITDDRFRDANILWGESTGRVKKVIDFSKSQIFVTQGFIGGTISGQSTTLGREGSDYTAAILANILDAESVIVWKDVPGILNAIRNGFRMPRCLMKYHIRRPLKWPSQVQK
jgi:aspartate kinase